MSKLILSYEKNIEKRELTFLGNVYDFSMIPNKYGSKADKPSFITQCISEHPSLSDNEEVVEALESLSFERDKDDIFEQLSTLNDYE